jgi:hypothetical protein
MHLQGIKDERKRSARKLAEMQEEVNANRETTYLYIKERKDVLGSKCVVELEFFDKGKNYLEWLYLHGHVTRVKKTIGGKRQYVYNVGAIPYIKPDLNAKVEVNTESMDKIASVTRVFKLLDRKQPPRHATEQPKRKVSVNIGSSMSLFSNF